MTILAEKKDDFMQMSMKALLHLNPFQKSAGEIRWKNKVCGGGES